MYSGEFSWDDARDIVEDSRHGVVRNADEVGGDAPARRARVQTSTELLHHAEEVGVVVVRAVNIVFVVRAGEDVHVRHEDACELPRKVEADEGERGEHVHALAEGEVVGQPGFKDDELDELVREARTEFSWR